MPAKFVPIEALPDLVFGLVGPIGVDLEYTSNSISDSVKSFGYTTHNISITKIMRELVSDILIDESDLSTGYRTKIEYANDLRKKYDSNDLLAALVISAISKIRREDPQQNLNIERVGRAFIIRQFKTPEEIRLMRSVYNKSFIQISVNGSPQKREDYLASRIKLSSRGTKTDEEARTMSRHLIKTDSKEEYTYGQNVIDTFPMGDVFLDFSDKDKSNHAINRFMAALFGSNEITPTKDEYGMYLAKTASLRSSDLSRQVGAAIFSQNGEIISLGSNEVPKAGGGTYWAEGNIDARDFQLGFDPNEQNKSEIFADLVARLFEDKFLSAELQALGEVRQIIDRLFNNQNKYKYKDSRVMNIIEFGRIIHAEMSAICDAARNGTGIGNATMYVTTFPCHICAKHVVASGIRRLVYLEPYPKSYTHQLHADSIQIDDHTDESKVHFQPFLGIAPYRYRDLFEKGKRKNSRGEAMKWKSNPPRPNIETSVPIYRQAEEHDSATLGKLIAPSNQVTSTE